MANKNNKENKGILRLRDLSEIAFVMHDYSLDDDVYLDIETGEVVHDLVGGRADDYETEEEAIDALILEGPDIDEDDFRLHEQIEAAGRTRYLRIYHVESWIPYQDMKDFIDVVDDARVQELLAVAIDGSGAFRRFKDVLDRYSSWQEEWFAFKKEKEESRVREWLEEEGFIISLEKQ